MYRAVLPFCLEPSDIMREIPEPAQGQGESPTNGFGHPGPFLIAITAPMDGKRLTTRNGGSSEQACLIRALLFDKDVPDRFIVQLSAVSDSS
jgi:hypothetical protein